MTGGPLKQGRIGVPIEFPIALPSGGLSVTRGIVRVVKPRGAQQDWSCSVASGATATSVTLLHITEAGDLDTAGDYGWTAYLYDGPSNADDLIHESVDMGPQSPAGIHVVVPFSPIPT